jgi:DNA-binding PadR family transcriptional regulator
MPSSGARHAQRRDTGTPDGAAIRSPVSWAVLGLLIERPGYGYELVKRFEREYAELLPIKSDWHIYRALDDLRTKGLIEEVPEKDGENAGMGRQPKPHYRTTSEGVTRYADWLVAHFGGPRRQSRLFVRQLAVLADIPDVALAVIDRYEQTCLGERDARLPGRRDGAASVNDARLAATLGAEESRLFLASILPWLHYARGEFEALAATRADPDVSA